MLALQSADGVAFNNYHGFLIFRRKGGRPNLLSPFFFLSKEEVKSKPTRARGNQPSDLREVADARVAFLVREQEERVRREAGKGSGCCPMLRRSFRRQEPLPAESLMPVPSPSPRIV